MDYLGGSGIDWYFFNFFIDERWPLEGMAIEERYRAYGYFQHLGPNHDNTTTLGPGGAWLQGGGQSLLIRPPRQRHRNPGGAGPGRC